MIKTKIIDNWLDEDLVNYLNNYFLYTLPHYYGAKSNDDDKSCFYNTPLNEQDALNKFLFYNSLKDSGAFEIKNEDIIPFVQNRLIIFDAKKLHRGLSPNKNEVRITLAFKIKE